MAVFIFDCPCCDERHVLDLAVSFEPAVKVDPKDWEIFLKVAERIKPKFHESKKFKQWQEAMA